MDISNFYFVPSSLTIILNLLPIISFINFFFNKASFEAIPISRMIANYINSISFFFLQFHHFQYRSSFYKFNKCNNFLEFSRYLIDAILNFIILVTGTSCCYQWLSKIIIEEITVGRIYIITNMTSLLIQMQYIYNGISKKNYLLIPITFDSISFPSYFSWIIYGLLIKDFYISITNIICCIVNLIQIFLYFYYRKENLTNINEETTIELGEESKKDFTSVENMKERPVKIETNSNSF